jgi:hypothetical protein
MIEVVIQISMISTFFYERTKKSNFILLIYFSLHLYCEQFFIKKMSFLFNNGNNFW